MDYYSLTFNLTLVKKKKQNKKHYFPWSHTLIASLQNQIPWLAWKVRPMQTNRSGRINAEPWNHSPAPQRHRVAQAKSATVAATREEVCSLVHSCRDCIVGLLRLVSLFRFTWKSLYKAPLAAPRGSAAAVQDFPSPLCRAETICYFCAFFVLKHGSVHFTGGIHGLRYVYIRHSAAGRR